MRLSVAVLSRVPPPCSGGIQWAWDDALCKDTGEAHGFPFLANHSSFEEQFHEARCMHTHPYSSCNIRLHLLTPHSRLHPTQPRSTPAQDLFFTNFISCKDIKASLHRAFQVSHCQNQT